MVAGDHLDLLFMGDCHGFGFSRGAAAFIQTEFKPHQRRIGAFALAGDERLLINSLLTQRGLPAILRSCASLRQNLDVLSPIGALIKQDFEEKQRAMQAVTTWAYLVCAGAMSRIRRLQLLVWP